MKVKLSENIKKFRKDRKMTQEQLAETKWNYAFMKISNGFVRSIP